MWSYNYTDELYHHGVKGMKWGVRRKRNKAAKEAGDKAAKEVINKYRNSPEGRKLGSARKAMNEASKARKAAMEKSLYETAGPMNKKYWEREFARRDKAAAEKKGRQEFRTKRSDFSKSRTTGSKVATFLLAGPLGNRTYNSVRTAGGSKEGAIAVTALASLAGPLGHATVSSLYTQSAGRQYRN